MSETPQDVIRIGTGTPQGLSRRDFLKVGGVATAALWLASCAPKGADIAGILSEGRKNLELLPLSVRQGIGRITIKQEDFGNKPDIAIEQTATCFVFQENDDAVTLVADRSFMKGVPLWKNVRAEFPEGSSLKEIFVPDAQMGAPGGKQPVDTQWRIDEESRPEKSFLFIKIHKPTGASARVTGEDYVLKVGQTQPQKGEPLLCAGFPLDSESPVGEGVKFKDTTQGLYRFEGEFIPGMEGGLICNIAGEAVAVTTAVKTEKGYTYGIPVVGAATG
jgi:hypothetical protein